MKLIKHGIQGKMLKIIHSLYENVKSCVKHNGLLSEYFSNTIGPFQGEVLSPILYSLYVNDCEIFFIREKCPSIEINLINLFLLMYADDMVLFAESPAALQTMIDTLYKYNKEWKLTLNVDKTKIVIFRNGGNIKENENWVYDGKEIQIVNQFSYLGMLFNYNGKFNETQKYIADQGRKAYFAILSKLKNHYFNIQTLCSVFDTYVDSILSYSSEIWGFHKAYDVEKIHINFCKKILGVKKSTCNSLVYYELGRLPLHILRKLKILRYWTKLKNSCNCILKACFEERVLLNDHWVLNIKNELSKLGLAYIWDETYIDKRLFKIIEHRFFDVYKHEMMSSIRNVTRGYTYQYLVDSFCMQFYLLKPIDDVYKKYITRFRVSFHCLNIEHGRYRNELRENRLCILCNLNDIEDEFHFILKCPFYSNLRQTYIKPYYYRNPSVFKLVQLMSVQNVRELRNL